MRAIVFAAFVILAAHDPALAARALEANPEDLMRAMRDHRVVLLGEVHDNAEQHALRAAALRKWVEGGARPAIAFEQFDREQQPAIDRARRDRQGDADGLIAQAKGASSWNWQLYKPYIALALEYDLPIVAANLSRAEAMKLATKPAAPAVPIPPAFLRAHERAIDEGHCRLLPQAALGGMARAQIARDQALARSIAPYAQRGVVLLTGNGHARKDIGVPHWLAADGVTDTVSIALLERGPDAADLASRFDS